jgi:predicted ester cyclase
MGFEENEAALMHAVDAWNSGDVDSYLNLYSDRIKLQAGTYDFPGKQAVAGMYRSFHAGVPGVRLEIHETLGVGDRLACRHTVRGMHTGELMGIPATGKGIAMMGITIMHFHEGEVTERWDSDDSAEVLARLRASAG